MRYPVAIVDRAPSDPQRMPAYIERLSPDEARAAFRILLLSCWSDDVNTRTMARIIGALDAKLPRNDLDDDVRRDGLKAEDLDALHRLGLESDGVMASRRLTTNQFIITRLRRRGLVEPYRVRDSSAQTNRKDVRMIRLTRYGREYLLARGGSESG